MPISPRIPKLAAALFAKPPEIEPARAVLLTESFRATEGELTVVRKAKAFARILRGIPIVIHESELIVGSSTLAPRGCQTYPEFSFEWLEAEFDTVASRSADPFYISEETKAALRAIHPYWKGRGTSDLAFSLMSPEARRAIDGNFFTPGNYFYNGVGHVCARYDKVLAIGFGGIIREAAEELSRLRQGARDYARRAGFLKAVILSCQAAVDYAARYSSLAREMAAKHDDPVRKTELLEIAAVCSRVPERGARSFRDACQSFWFVQQLIQLESSGHSISPGRFDQYMYPYYIKDLASGAVTPETAQELIDCVWVKLNDLNKCRDAASAEGFAGYSLFQNLIVGGQDEDGRDAANDLSYMCIEASAHVRLPQPSLSVRVWNGSPGELLIKAARLTRSGVGLPAYYNDEVIIPALMNRGLPLADARDYCVIGCVEPQKPGKTEGWHDAAFFNLCRPLEEVFGGDLSALVTYDDFYAEYRRLTEYYIELLVNADNAIDAAHAERAPLPFLSALVDDCVARGRTVQEGGAVYNFTGPQGFGVANVADSLLAVKKLVYEQKRVTLEEYRDALAADYWRNPSAGDIAKRVAEEIAARGANTDPDAIAAAVIKAARVGAEQKAQGDRLLAMIAELPKYGNDEPEVDEIARAAANIYARALERYENPRGGRFQAGLYPVSANVPLGAQTGATPDGRLAGTPVADGVSPAAGRDVNGPTAAANSVSKLDHAIASNGTLYNIKFHPSVLEGESGLWNFVAFVRAYFDRKGSHMQFNVVSRETLLDAQRNPGAYKSLVVRVAGYSALFTSLSRALQDDIINRTSYQSL
jgi:formate C-acetyltransferase